MTIPKPQRIELPHLTTDKPGPIQAVGKDFLYQLDASPNSLKTNLWSGQLSPNNDYSPEYAEKAVKLFLAAEDLLAALVAIEPFIPTSSAADGGASKYSANVIAADMVRAAINKATSTT